MGLPFEQQAGESDKAFAAFSVYLSLGVERSLAEVGRRLGKSMALLERWSARWRWVERVRAHGAHLALVEREASEALARGVSAEWLRRQQAVRETEWQMHEACIAAAKRALKAFQEREKVFANLADIARMLEVASKLGRLAAGMATDRTELSGEAGGPIRVELSAALAKVYGDDVEIGGTSPRPVPQGGEGARKLLVGNTSPCPSPQRGEGKRSELAGSTSPQPSPQGGAGDRLAGECEREPFAEGGAR